MCTDTPARPGARERPSREVVKRRRPASQGSWVARIVDFGVATPFLAHADRFWRNAEPVGCCVRPPRHWIGETRAADLGPSGVEGRAVPSARWTRSHDLKFDDTFGRGEVGAVRHTAHPFCQERRGIRDTVSRLAGQCRGRFLTGRRHAVPSDVPAVKPSFSAASRRSDA
jgi:hypothetical protein